MRAQETYLFGKRSVFGALLRLVFPTVVGQIILVIYNMADTFFIGMRGNDAMLTAVTICMRAFMFLSAISNLFGIGGGRAPRSASGSVRPCSGTTYRRTSSHRASRPAS